MLINESPAIMYKMTREEFRTTLPRRLPRRFAPRNDMVDIKGLHKPVTVYRYVLRFDTENHTHH